MVRVLLCGDARAGLRKINEQVARMHAKLDEKHHFEAIFCVGEFSASDFSLWSDGDADIRPQCPVHFIDSGNGAARLIKDSPKGQEVRPGVHFLGHFGVSRVAGLCVAYLSGRYRADLFAAAADEAAIAASATTSGAGPGPTWEEVRAAERLAEAAKTQAFVDGIYYTPHALEQLKEQIANSGGVDLLLTSEWPAGCLSGVPKEARTGLDKDMLPNNSSPAVADLVSSAEPKYHAVGLAGQFWRCPPWTHVHRGEVVPATGELHCGVCRMVALGSVPSTVATARSAATTDTGANQQQQQQPQPNQVSSASELKQQKWLHGLDLDPHAPPAQAADATPSPWLETKKASEGEKLQPLQLDVTELMDPKDKRRWLKKFGVLPQDLQFASNRIANDVEKANEKANKNKGPRRESLYSNQKSDKRFKAGKGSNDAFHQKERRAANGKSAGNF